MKRIDSSIGLFYLFICGFLFSFNFFEQRILLRFDWNTLCPFQMSTCVVCALLISYFQDTRAHAESAKETMDGKTLKGRQLRVRFAVHGAALRIKELSPCVSNEMLYHTFSVFGEVERAVHIVDERGKPTGEGIVEFERKAAAQDALKNIEERVFMITA